jgi:hypothetical protein
MFLMKEKHFFSEVFKPVMSFNLVVKKKVDTAPED